MTTSLTRENLREILNGNRESDLWYDALVKHLSAYGINTNKRLAHFLSQTTHESNNFTVLEENLNYSATRLNQVFPKYFRNAGRDATKFARKPEAIANIVYASRMGNGNEASGDGFRYRGRGIIQLTGKNNYRDFGATVGKSSEEVTEYVMTKEGAIQSALWFWNSRNINNAASGDDVAAVTRLINGGTNGLEDRRDRYNRILNILSKTPVASGPEHPSTPPVANNFHGMSFGIGDRGPMVGQIQKALGIPVSDVYGPFTHSAVKKFQAANGLTVDGIAGPRTLSRLFK